jgi:sugar/nucleoside kinase (ribokinase family)
MTLVGVGHALADAYAFVGEDVPKVLGLHPGTFNQVPDYRMRAILLTLSQKTLMAGGSAANTVKLAARLGVDSHFVGQCGHDEAGQVFEAELLAAGVKVNLTRSDAPTGLCVTFLAPTSDRTVATFRSASGNLPLNLVGDTILGAADTVVVEGYLLDEPEFLTNLLNRCHRAGKGVSFDTAEGHLVEHHGEDLARHIAAGRISSLFLPEADAASLTGKDAEGALEALGRNVGHVVLKRGDRGWLVRDGGKLVAVPLAESGAVDYSGSGDGFQAGFLWAQSQGWKTVDCCRAGAAVAACVIQAPGTRVDDARWAALQAELTRLTPSR